MRVERLISSEWCRCLDTARLLELGPVETAPDALNSFFDAPSEKARSVATSVLVTHQVNVTALTGVFPASGEIVVLRLEPGGSYAVAGRLSPR